MLATQHTVECGLFSLPISCLTEMQLTALPSIRSVGSSGKEHDLKFGVQSVLDAYSFPTIIT